MRQKLCEATVFFLLAGCSPTSYQPQSEGPLSWLSGGYGYRDQYLGDNTYLIRVRVSSYTDEATAFEYFHRRAQELCGSYKVLSLDSSAGEGRLVDGRMYSYERPEVYGRVRCQKDKEEASKALQTQGGTR